MRVGEWRKKSRSAGTTNDIALQAHNTARRTGTTLQLEEANMRTAQREIRTHDESQTANNPEGRSLPPNCRSPETLLATENPRIGISRDYYQCEWFRILIGMMLLLISTIILPVIFLSGRSVVDLYEPALFSIIIGLFSSIFYIAIFVFLEEHHEGLERLFNTCIHTSPRSQKICLRLFAYVYPCGVLVADTLVFFFAILSMIFPFPLNWSVSSPGNYLSCSSSI